jgi:hypothetical protein
MVPKFAPLLGVILGCSALLAADPAPAPTRDVSQQDIVNMQSCRMRCMAVFKMADDLSAVINGAKASNDPAQMKAALERAAQVIKEAKNAHEQCLAARMQGGDMGGMRPRFRNQYCQCDAKTEAKK